MPAARRMWTLLAAGLLVAAPHAMSAQLMNYVISGNGTGSLGGISFTDAPFQIALMGDVGAIQLDTYKRGDYVIPNITGATVTVAGVTATITEPLFVFSNHTDVANAGIGTAFADLLNFKGPTQSTFQLYNLASPISTSIQPGLVNRDPLFPTTAGDFSLGFEFPSNGHFVASAAVVATPEPSSFLLLATGFLGMVAIGRKRSSRV